MASIIGSLGIFGSFPLPMFGTLRQAAQFAIHNSGALQRLAPWGAALGIGAGWVVWPALTQDFKAGFGIGQSLEDESAAKVVVTDDNKATAGIDYSATGALQSFKTREGVKNKFESDDIDQTPKNLDEDAHAQIMKATGGSAGHGDDAMPVAESVDALRRFSTRVGAKYEFRASSIDQTPKLEGGDDDEDDEDDE